MHKIVLILTLLSICLVQAFQDVAHRLPQHPSSMQEKSCRHDTSLGFAPSLLPKLARTQLGISSAFAPGVGSTKVLSPTIPLRQSRQMPEMQLDPGTAAFLCGSIAGVTSSFMVFPVDTAKTKMQTASCEDEKKKYSSVTGAISEVFKESGLSGLFRGCGPALLGSAPEAAIQMTAHDATYGMLASMPHDLDIFVIQTIAGAAAGFFTILATNPLEVLKIRGQLSENGQNDSKSKEGPLETLQTLGFQGLFKGSFSTWVRDIPFYAAYFPLYEFGKAMVATPLLAGLMAGVLATLLTLPADLIKTRIQAQNFGTNAESRPTARSKSLWNRTGRLSPKNAKDGPALIMAYSDAAGQQWHTLERRLRASSTVPRKALNQWLEEGKQLVAERGWAGLYAGGQAGVLRKGAAMAISLSVYETLHDLAQMPLKLGQAAMAGGATEMAQHAVGIAEGVEGAEGVIAALSTEVPVVMEAVGHAAVAAALL